MFCGLTSLSSTARLPRAAASRLSSTARNGENTLTRLLTVSGFERVSALMLFAMTPLRKAC